MGLADAIWPAPQTCTFPTLLDFPAPEVLAYPREAVVAEKFEAMVVLGGRNSRPDQGCPLVLDGQPPLTSLYQALMSARPRSRPRPPRESRSAAGTTST